MASASNQKFIADNLKADTSTLLLKYYGQEEKRFLVEQIAARQRIRKKLPEWYAHPQLILPPTLNLEQSSSSETARLKASMVQGASFADLTGGLGVDFYFLSQKFRHSIYVEPEPELFQMAVYNFKVLKLSGQFLNLSAEEALPHLPEQDLIYLDPSRRSAEKTRVINLSDYAPNTVKLQNKLLQTAREVIIKTSPMYGLEEGIKQFHSVSEVWIISVRNDCKELLFKLKPAQEGPRLKTWNLLPESQQYFEAPLKDNAGPLTFAEPLAYLYEPNASILKAGLAEQVAIQHKVKKLHPNSQIYTSDEAQWDYPGKIFSLTKSHKPFTKSLKKKRFNIISRNFPEKASKIERKLQVKPARTAYLIATTTQKQKLFLEAELLN